MQNKMLPLNYSFHFPPVYNYQRWKFHLENSGTEMHLWIPRLSLIAQ